MMHIVMQAYGLRIPSGICIFGSPVTRIEKKVLQPQFIQIDFCPLFLN